MTPKVIDKSIFDCGGKTLISLASDGSTLCVANKSGLAKVLQTEKPEEEPEVLETSKNLTSVHCDTNSSFILTTVEGDVYRYNFKNGKDQLLARFALPIRDSTLAHSGKIVVIGGDDLELALIELDGETPKKHTVKVVEQVSQLSCTSQTNILSVSYTNGVVQFFSLNSTKPNKVHEITSVIPANSYRDSTGNNALDAILDDSIDDSDDDEEEKKVKDPEFCDENRICTRAAWHPTGLHFALPSKDNNVQVYSIRDYKLERTLTTSTKYPSHFTDLQFDTLNGSYIASIDLNNVLVVWDWANAKVIYTDTFKNKLTNITWKVQKESNKLDLILSTWSGDVISIQDLVESTPNLEKEASKEGTGRSNLFVDSDISEGSDEEEQGDPNNDDGQEKESSKRKYHFDDEEDFIDDDDGAGYVAPKRPDNISTNYKQTNNRSHSGIVRTPNFHYGPISPGATPYGNSDRRYLTMNSIGYVVSVRNNDQNSVTVSFFDLGKFSEYHFEDLFGYDICSLNDRGTLFGQSKTGQIHYRPHSSLNANWTKSIPLQRGERITCVTATPKRINIGTSYGYLRTFNQFGVAISVEKMSPIVCMAAYEYKVFTVHYSVFHGVSYSLFEQSPSNLRYFQRECPLPIMLPQGNPEVDRAFDSDFTHFNPMGIKSIFFSIYGDPCIFGNDNVLLILSKWRSAMKSRWIPILDSNMEVWKMSGGKDSNDVHVWPLGLTYDTLNCILVKGKNPWPDFPLPLPSELEVRIPTLVKSQILQETKNKKKLRTEEGILDDEEEDGEGEGNEELEIPVNMAAEEEYLRAKVLSTLLNDTLDNDGELYGNEREILKGLTGEHDKSLLRLFADACAEQSSDKALSIAQELEQDRALNAAMKISERAELMTLVKKINTLREARFEQQQ
ncbi:hypothetical protein Kpol_1050p99 [Vanderwaltozyma polyspora DSM 70294]|uniref:Uncharacterized protein n=1 Tax=Vanderwaltozyma polyspora (strain ATCC 22028 / DSM 70294 / BCRC 21397 / CBS 2163 / NBRC 10782 / NRRL Y-8283 / UCD 57-17) TaxID=436907 RepID=A7TEZ3_VANPO|nr:uncharacterized protein Kpol_1050p99 [Vanderwaltozyma polyspora DSM 70294]EDO19239.1 hypothetical protein Kpol_1050p99 [Vanderwaltozyma polyspora DSM 70294]